MEKASNGDSYSNGDLYPLSEGDKLGFNTSAVGKNFGGGADGASHSIGQQQYESEAPLFFPFSSQTTLLLPEMGQRDPRSRIRTQESTPVAAQTMCTCSPR